MKQVEWNVVTLWEHVYDTTSLYSLNTTLAISIRTVGVYVDLLTNSEQQTYQTA